jgi:hypothetical protein
LRSRQLVQSIRGRLKPVRSAILSELIRDTAELPGSIRILLPIVVRQVLQLLLEITCCRLQVLLLLRLLASLLLSLRSRLKLADLFGRPGLLLSQALQFLASLLDSLLKILRVGRAVLRIQQAVGLVHGIEGLLLRLLLLLRGAGVFGVAQVLGRVLQIPRRLLHLRIVLLRRLPLELTRHLFEIPAQLLDIPLVGFGVLGLLAQLPLQLRLLALGEFLEFVGRLLFLRRLLLPFTALHGFVLVLALIEFEFEQIGKIFGVLLTAASAASAAALSLLHLDFGEKCRGLSKVVVGLTLERNRRGGIGLHQVLRDRRHFLDGLVDVLGEILDHLILR